MTTAELLRTGQPDGGVSQFAAASLAILRSRLGRYPDGRDRLDDGARFELLLAGAEDGDAVTVTLVARSTDAGVRCSSSETSTIGPDRGGRLVLRRPSRLDLREGGVDGFRSARFVFGVGDIEGDGACEEVLLQLHADGGVTYVHAWGRPGDSFAMRTIATFGAPVVAAAA